MRALGSFTAAILCIVMLAVITVAQICSAAYANVSEDGIKKLVSDVKLTDLLEANATTAEELKQAFTQAGVSDQGTINMLNSEPVNEIFAAICYSSLSNALEDTPQITDEQLSSMIDERIDDIVSASGEEITEDGKIYVAEIFKNALPQLKEITKSGTLIPSTAKVYIDLAMDDHAMTILIAVAVVLVIFVMLLHLSFFRGLKWSGTTAFISGCLIILIGLACVGGKPVASIFHIIPSGYYTAVLSAAGKIGKSFLINGVITAASGLIAVLLSSAVLNSGKRRRKKS